MAIQGSRLHAALSARWRNRPTDWAIILEQLNFLDDHTTVRLNKDRGTTIDNCMSWDTTPQGHAFWSRYSRMEELIESGRWPDDQPIMTDEQWEDYAPQPNWLFKTKPKKETEYAAVYK